MISPAASKPEQCSPEQCSGFPPAALSRTLTLTTNGQAQFRFPFDPALTEALKLTLTRSLNRTRRTPLLRLS